MNDSISCLNPNIKVHECKYKVDGVTKYVENHEFEVDDVFSELDDTDEVYRSSMGLYLDTFIEGGILTILAYGQTGSGKTYTMKGVQRRGMEEMFKKVKAHKSKLTILVSFYEVYGGKCFDLFQNNSQIKVMEDKTGKVTMKGMIQKEIGSASEMITMIEYGFSMRTTHSTLHNDTSSRSHAICIIVIKDKDGKEHGKMVLVDLAVNLISS